MSKLGYRAEFRNRKITKFEVLRETEYEVVIRGRSHREAYETKRSQYHAWYDTWEDAHKALLQYWRLSKAGYELQLEVCREKLQEIEEMLE